MDDGGVMHLAVSIYALAPDNYIPRKLGACVGWGASGGSGSGRPRLYRYIHIYTASVLCVYIGVHVFHSRFLHAHFVS